MTSSLTTPQLPPELFPTGMSVALIARPIEPGVLAHRSSSEERLADNGYGGKSRVTTYIAACAVGQDDADEAYLVSVHWAAHQGAGACTEQACFPQAVSA